MNRISIVAIPCLITVLTISCAQRTGTQTLLDANFVSKDEIRPMLVEPSEASSYSSTSITFSWSSGVSGPVSIEVATDADFANIVLRKETQQLQYTWQAADQLAGFTAATGTYFWRVRSAFTSAVSSTRSLFLYIAGSIPGGDPLYVNGSASLVGQNGSSLNPFTKISDAIAVSDTLRNNDATKQVRIIVAQGTYTEEILLRPGISIFGGYNASQVIAGAIVWARNIAIHETIIQAPYDNAIVGGAAVTTAYRSTTVVDGFTVRGGSSLVSTRGITLSNSSPTIRNCTISGGAGVGTGASRYGINVVDGASPHIFNNTIYATLTATVGGSTDVAGIRVNNGSSALIDGNRVGIAPASGIPLCCGLPAITIRVRTNSTATIRNNLILGAGMGWAYGIQVLGPTATANIYNNTIYMPVSGMNSAAIRFEGSAANVGDVENNIIGTNAASTTRCISEGNNSSSPTTLRNNNFFGCTNIYTDITYNPMTMLNVTTNMTTVCAGNPGDAGCATLLATPAGSGNISIDNTGNQLFINLTGPDTTVYGIADNDWRLTTNPAICDVRGGARNLSVDFTTDFLNVTRTTTLPAACTPVNAGAAGWSMGAHESD